MEEDTALGDVDRRGGCYRLTSDPCTAAESNSVLQLCHQQISSLSVDSGGLAWWHK